MKIPRTLALALIPLAGVALLVLGAPSNPPTPGGHDWEVYSDRAVDLVTGKVYPWVWGQTDAPLTAAAQLSRPGDVVRVMESVPNALSIAIGSASKQFEAVRADPFDLTIEGTPGATIGPVAFGARKYPPGGAPGFAVEGLTLRDIRVDGRGAQNPIAGFFKSEYGDIALERVVLFSNASTKWGTRIHGHARSIKIVGCTYTMGGVEWGIYIDNTTGSPGWGPSVLIEGNIIAGWGRGAFQGVTREFPATNSNYRNPGAALGDIILRWNIAYGNGSQGASALTIAGWPRGRVVIRGNDLSGTYESGGIMIWGDKQKLGGMALPGGWAFRRVTLRENRSVFPKGVRPNVGVRDAKNFEMRIGKLSELYLKSANIGVDLKHKGGKNGAITLVGRFPPSVWNVYGAKPWAENTNPIDPNQYWVQP